MRGLVGLTSKQAGKDWDALLPAVTVEPVLGVIPKGLQARLERGRCVRVWRHARRENDGLAVHDATHPKGAHQRHSANKTNVVQAPNTNPITKPPLNSVRSTRELCSARLIGAGALALDGVTGADTSAARTERAARPLKS